MKAFTSELITKLLNETASFYLLVEMQLNPTPVCITDRDTPHYYRGNMYQPGDISLADIATNAGMQVDKVDVTIQNVDQIMASYFLNNDQRGKKIIIRFTCLDADRVPIETPLLFKGMIAFWELNENEIKIDVKSDMVLWKKKTLRKSSSLCPWTPGTIECGLSAGTKCAKTFINCLINSNPSHFGGFRFTPDMMEKELLWGPK